MAILCKTDGVNRNMDLRYKTYPSVGSRVAESKFSSLHYYVKL